MNQITLWMLWGFFAVEAPLYIAVTRVLTRGETSMAPDRFVVALAGVAGVTALATFAVWGALVARPARRGRAPSASRVFLAYILTWAMAQSVMLYGGVVAFAGYGFGAALPFFAAGAVLMLLHMPRAARLAGTQMPLRPREAGATVP